MTAFVPVVAPSLTPDERQQPSQPAKPAKPAKKARARIGRHEPIRSSTPRIAARGAALGLTVAAGVVGSSQYLRGDVHAGLTAGAQLGSLAAGMAFAGAWAERRRMSRIARAASDLAMRLATASLPDEEAVPQLLAVPGADRVALEVAARRTGTQAGARRAARLLGRVALLRTLL
jgi:hypothetical protein